MRHFHWVAAVTASAVASANATTYTWHDAQPLIHGTGFAASDKSAFYDRLPSGANATTRSAVWSLSRDAAGLFAQFVSNAPAFVINVSYVYDSFTMWHFPSTGVAGLDLYAWDAGNVSWRWVGTTHTQGPGLTASNQLTGAPLPGGTPRTYRLHLPTYNGVRTLSIGVPSTATLGPDQSYSTPPPVVVYGTSITQGGVASRPGMAWTNVLTRSLGREVLNFGFSGNGLMEQGVAEWLVKIGPVGAFVIDCVWNMSPQLVAQNAPTLITFIRQSHPTTPLVLVEDTEAGASWISPAVAQLQADKRANLRAAYDAAVKAGDTNIHYVNASVLYLFSKEVAVDPRHIISPTVGGCHPSDLGQAAIAEAYRQLLPPLLEPTQHLSWRPTQQHSHPTLSTPRETTATEQIAHAAALELEFGPVSAHSRTTDTKVSHSKSAQPPPPPSPYSWVDVEVSSLVVMGRAFNDTATATGGYFNRLPASAASVVRSEVWSLSQDSTGMFVPFVTSSSEIAWNFSLVNAPAPLWHMPASGMHGADLFCHDGTDYRFVGAAEAYPQPGTSQLVVLGSGLAPTGADRRCLIYLPLRNTIAAAAVGTVGGTVKPDPVFAADGVTWDGKKPIVWYGTSIDQGGVASRPGSTYTNVLSRLLGRMVLNFGFAGNGVMEETVAQFLTELDPALFVIDCLPNMDPDTVTNRTVPLVKYLRERHPTTPILLTAGTTYGDHWFSPSSNDLKRAALKAQYDALVAGGDTNVHLFLNSNDELFASNALVNPTVGGTHPSDLGHREIATFWAGYLPSLLGQ